MLKVYQVAIEMIREIAPVITQIEKRDIDLARQLKRAASSVALNMAEASGSRGGIRNARYRTALGSARETRACLDVAEAFGYCAAGERVRGQLSVLSATLWKLTA